MPLGTCVKKLLLRRGQHTQIQQSTADAENFVIFSQRVTMNKSHLGRALSKQFNYILGKGSVLTVQLHPFTSTGTAIHKTSEEDSLWKRKIN